LFDPGVMDETELPSRTYDPPSVMVNHLFQSLEGFPCVGSHCTFV